MKISKLTLGTAQLGLNYGISNINGKPDFNYSLNLLKYAWKNGINTFDTAPTYGNSEKIIGDFIVSNFKSIPKNLTIITKLSALQINNKMNFDDFLTNIKNTIIQTLRNLKIKKIPIYLIHHAPDLYLKNGIIIKCLSQLKNEGLIDRIGISIYNQEEIIEAFKYKELDVIQIPINIFDHRLIHNKILKKLKEKNYLIFARSIFLQGLFFIDLECLPKNLEIAKNYLLKLRNICKDYKIELDKLALLFVRELPEIDSIVIGVERLEQLKRNLILIEEKPLRHNILNRIFLEFSDVPELIINPSLWKTI